MENLKFEKASVGDVFETEAFIRMCKAGVLINNDGFGEPCIKVDNKYYVCIDYEHNVYPSDIRIRDKVPSTPYVMWYNK